MRKAISVIMFLVMTAIFTACGKSADSVQNTEISASEPVQSEEIQGNLENNGTDSQTTETADTKNTAEQSEQGDDMKAKTLVVYFSCTGTTKTLAEYAADILASAVYNTHEPIVSRELYGRVSSLLKEGRRKCLAKKGKYDYLCQKIHTGVSDCRQSPRQFASGSSRKRTGNSL